jgi:hypothetical protein
VWMCVSRHLESVGYIGLHASEFFFPLATATVEGENNSGWKETWLEDALHLWKGHVADLMPTFYPTYRVFFIVIRCL